MARRHVCSQGRCRLRGRVLVDGTMRYDLHNDADERGGMSVQESLFADQARVLEQIALGRPLREILISITHLIETHAPGTLCSILLLDDDGAHLRCTAAPSFPDEFNRAVDGLPVGPDVGSCGAAAFYKKPVFVNDIATDPKWAKFKDLALKHGLRACGSGPIPLPGGRIAGTFALYSRRACAPNVHHLELLEVATHLAGIAIQREESVRAHRESEHRFRETFDRCAAGIVHVALDGRIILANKRYADWLGYAEEELLELHVRDITAPEDFTVQGQEMRRLIEGQIETFKMDKRYVRKDGSIVWGNLIGSLAHDAQGNPDYFIGVVEDIDERKRMQSDRDQILQREQAARAQAEAANRSKDQLLAVVSHELRTPLTPILAAVGLLARNASLPPEAKHLLATIKRNAELEARLIDDLLDLTRITNGKIRLHMEPADAHSLIDSALDIYRNEMKSKGLELETHLDAKDRTLHADPARVQQVFWNLVSNSVKFTPTAGRLIVRTSNPAPGKLRVEVTDTGTGIDPDIMRRLFSAFEQGEQSLTRRHGGLGLGLSISKALVELHGGTITARSEGKGTGTTFVVEFPTHHAKSNGKGGHGAPSSKRMQILLVEDNHDTAGLMRRLLNQFGHDVTTAATLNEAMTAAEGNRFDLLISDIGLPDGSGWELMRRLRERHQDVKGIALSGFGTEEDARHSREAGFLEHMVKPISIHKLEQLLQTLAN